MFRRKFLLGAGACLCAGCFSASAQQAVRGCMRAATAANIVPADLLASSGSDRIDQICRDEIGRLNRHFGVNPMFGFYRDRRMNAQATQRRYSPKHPDGAVLIGINFAKFLLDAGDIALIVILAHEWGHILQFKQRVKFVWNVRYELDADGAAGAYLHSVNPDEEFGERAAQLFEKLGDNDFTRQDHHGTPEQRSDVFRTAFGLTTGIFQRGPAPAN